MKSRFFPSFISKLNVEAILFDLLANGVFDFEQLALETFRYQADANPVYQKYLSLVKQDVAAVKSLDQIPFLPISCFKHHDIKSGEWTPVTYFKSSGTTGQKRSKHAIKSFSFYEQWSLHQFKNHFEIDADTLILALLPNYLEQGDSSLVHMVARIIKEGHPKSGFYLHNIEELVETISWSLANNKRLILFGVTYALLDLARHKIKMPGATIIETGGMKGRRKEMIRSELHAILNAKWGCPIYSEYGMTELFSQAYTDGSPLFTPSQSLKVLPYQVNDPGRLETFGQTARLHMIDLANVHSCSFIATEDLGRVYPDGRFEVLGRHDLSEQRGCNLMVD